MNSDIVYFTKSLSNNWIFILALIVIALIALAFHNRVKNYKILLCFASLFCIRKLVLFIPVWGAISDLDHVFFLSCTSLNSAIFVVIAIIISGFLVYHIHDIQDFLTDCISTPFGLYILFFVIIGSFIFVWIDNYYKDIDFIWYLTHLTMFTLNCFFLLVYYDLLFIKFLISNPLFLIIIWVSIIIYFILILTRKDIIQMDFISNLFINILCIGLIGFLTSFAFQWYQLCNNDAYAISRIQSWEDNDITLNGDTSFFFSQHLDLVSLYLAKLPEINKQQYNLFNKKITNEEQKKQMDELLNSRIDIWDKLFYWLQDVLINMCDKFFHWLKEALFYQTPEKDRIKYYLIGSLMFLLCIRPKSSIQKLLNIDTGICTKAINSGLLSRRILIKICRKSEEKDILLCAWEKLRNNLTDREASKIVRSLTSILHQQVVQSGKLSRKMLFTFCQNRSEIVRKEALNLIVNNLKRCEINFLRRSRYTDLRLAMIEHGRLELMQLLHMYSDKQILIREAVREEIINHDMLTSEGLEFIHNMRMRI